VRGAVRAAGVTVVGGGPRLGAGEPGIPGTVAEAGILGGAANGGHELRPGQGAGVSRPDSVPNLTRRFGGWLAGAREIRERLAQL
jgi:hypothetical protein